MTPSELRLRAAILQSRGYTSDKAELCDDENAALLLDFATVLEKCARITDGDVLEAWRIWYGDDNESLSFDDMTDAEKTRTRSALAKVWPVPPVP